MPTDDKPDAASDPGCCGCITLIVFVFLMLVLLKAMLYLFAVVWHAIPSFT